MQQSLLSVIIISYNTKELTIQTIESVFASTYPSLEVIVVDNNSHDGSVEALQEKYGKKIHLIVNPDNRGFAYANNMGIRKASGEYVILLNSDTIVAPDALSAMVAALSSHPTVGAVAASLRYVDGRYQPQGGALPNVLNLAVWWLWPLPGATPLIPQYQDPRDVVTSHMGSSGVIIRGWVGGTALVVKRDVYLEMHGLDEGIFMYAEDIDFCLRLKKQGLAVGIVPAAIITHIGSASAGSLNARLGEVKGLLYLFAKHKSTISQVVLRLIFIVGSLLRYVLFGILKRNKEARVLYSTVLRLSLS